jgi:hypothetical protein
MMKTSAKASSSSSRNGEEEDEEEEETEIPCATNAHVLALTALSFGDPGAARTEKAIEQLMKIAKLN